MNRKRAAARKLRIGRIPYANLFPIYHYLDNECDRSRYRFIRGVPSRLNFMLRSGELDISPSSSIEFLRNRARYRILPWHSISATGPVKSILLFSRVPIHDLGRATIAVTSDSATSTVLLKIIMRDFLSLRCSYRITDLRSVRGILSSASAVLHIGDTAMREAGKLGMSILNEEQGRGKKFSRDRRTSWVYIYDLGELWHHYTGLPFVYALWVVRKKALEEKTDLVMALSSDLIKAKEYARQRLPLIAQEAPQRRWITEEGLLDYWDSISYDFTEQHLEGLRLFEKLALKK